MEKAGRSVNSMLQRSDPSKSRTCGWTLCFVYETEKKELCDKNGVNNIITSLACENSGTTGEYIGEISKNAYTRGKQHQDEYRKQSSESVLWRHCQERHNNEREEFTMHVTGQYRNDAMLLTNSRIGTDKQ